MERFDSAFSKLKSGLGVTGANYDANNIQFDCLESSIDHFEAEYSRLSDYALTYVKYIVEACEKHSVEEIKTHLNSGIELAKKLAAGHSQKTAE